MTRFTVDTHLFQELGELLVGRSSTALVELIKNAYDADAQVVHVSAGDLAQPERGWITVIDDGLGMTAAEFSNGFLRIAGRGKQAGSRRSARYKRRFTGAKGIGRLAAHKLAHELRVSSVPDPSKLDKTTLYQVVATIDWDMIESHETLEEAEAGIRVSRKPVRSTVDSGTTIRLRCLRRAWTPTERENFYNEVSTFQPPSAVATALPPAVLRQPLLFEDPKIRDLRAKDPGFAVHLEGELASGDDPWAEFAEGAAWVLEVDAARDGVRYAIAPTLRTAAQLPNAEVTRVTSRHPDRANGPFFQARVFIREGPAPKALRQRIRHASGVRVYMEGFRVLPYGESGNDWLGVSRSYSERVGGLPLLDDSSFGDPVEKEGFLRPTNDQLHGAVFLLEKNAENLRMLVNREGFVPEAGYEHLVDIMRRGINLSTRTRAAASVEVRRERRDQRETRRMEQEEEETRLRAAQAELEASLARASAATEEASHAADAGDIPTTRRALQRVTEQLTSSVVATEELSAEQGLLRVLASVGTQMAAFIHELNRIVENVAALEELIASEPRNAQLRRLVGDVRRSLERQASYLVDVIGPDTRRRRTRQRVADRVEVGWRFVADAAVNRGVELRLDIDEDLKMPPMFPAETAAVFTNLLTNAVKNAGDHGRVRVAARERDRRLVIRVENTGTAVDLNEAERWFAPFQSTTVDVDPVLGQGLGLGLPITREILAQYGISIFFAKPRRVYATALEVVFP